MKLAIMSRHPQTPFCQKLSNYFVIFITYEKHHHGHQSPPLISISTDGSTSLRSSAPRVSATVSTQRRTSPQKVKANWSSWDDGYGPRLDQQGRPEEL